MKKRLLSLSMKAMNALAIILAIQTVNTCCVFIHHQPKVPEGLKDFAK